MICSRYVVKLFCRFSYTNADGVSRGEGVNSTQQKKIVMEIRKKE